MLGEDVETRIGAGWKEHPEQSRTAKGLPSPTTFSEAEDAASEVFAIAWRRIDDLELSGVRHRILEVVHLTLIPDRCQE